MESILDSVKQMVGGISFDDTTFDAELILHINSALMVLTQLGVGPSTGFRISGNEETWKDFIGDHINLEAIKTEVALRVRLVFDPPQNSFLVAAIQKQIEEYDWRIANQMGSS
jgi:hypothetical protein